jgi:hypothetical protein
MTRITKVLTVQWTAVNALDDDNGNSSKAPACDLKGLKFEPAGQDLEEFMASKENLLELFAIISRYWSTAVEEDGNYIRIYPNSKTICCCLQCFHSRQFAMIQE